jgi:hypothetical protein
VTGDRVDRSGPLDPDEGHEPVEAPSAPSSRDPRGISLRSELKDAITPRAFLLVLAVLGIGLGFIGSYLGAFHNPTPHGVKLGVAVPGAPTEAAVTAARLNRLSGHPLSAVAEPSYAAAVSAIRDRTLAGALVVSATGHSDRLLVASAEGGALSDALQGVMSQVEHAQGRYLVTQDIVPASAGDARGLSAFYLVVGWMVGGYLAASFLGLSAGSRPANTRRLFIRLGALLLYSIAAGLGGALLVYAIIPSLPSGHLLPLWGLGTLLVFAVAVFTTALQVVAGIVGIGIAIIIFVVLGNPSAGGAYPWPLLPAFWRTIGPWLPPGAGVEADRSITYFSNHALLVPLLVLAGYAFVGMATSAFVTARASNGRKPLSE